MTRKQLRASLRRHKLTQAGFAELIGVNPRTVRSWLAGRLPVPVVVGVLVELLDESRAEGLEAVPVGIGGKK